MQITSAMFNTTKDPPPCASKTTARNLGLTEQKLESHAFRVMRIPSNPFLVEKKINKLIYI